MLMKRPITRKTKMFDTRVEIRVDCQGWHRFSDSIEEIIRNVVTATLEATQQCADCEISILLTDDTSVAKLNKTWLGKSGPTNVLSFPTSKRCASPSMVLGDVVFALQTVRAEALSAEINELDHFKHLLVHGLLHLLGHDHMTSLEAQVMEKWEVRILAALGVSDPYDEPNGAIGHGCNENT